MTLHCTILPHSIYCLLYKSLHIKQMVLLLDLTAWLQTRQCCTSKRITWREILPGCRNTIFIIYPKNVWCKATIFQEINLFCFSTTLTLTLRIIRKMKYYPSNQSFLFSIIQKNWNIQKMKWYSFSGIRLKIIGEELMSFYSNSRLEFSILVDIIAIYNCVRNVFMSLYEYISSSS